MKKLVYIAGPFSPSNGKTMEENTEFAEIVGRYAQSLGFAPVVPHSSILRGVYGDDTLERERIEGTLSTLSIMAAVMDSPESELWVIMNVDVTMTRGTKEEFDIWIENRSISSVRMNRASEWEKVIKKHFLDKLVKETPYEEQEDL